MTTFICSKAQKRNRNKNTKIEDFKNNKKSQNLHKKFVFFDKLTARQGKLFFGQYLKNGTFTKKFSLQLL